MPLSTSRKRQSFLPVSSLSIGFKPSLKLSECSQNDEVCNSSIEKVAARPNIKGLINVTLTYDTPLDKIQRAIEIIRQLLSLEEDGDRSEDELGRPSN